jgi:hypothetical protein
MWLTADTLARVSSAGDVSYHSSRTFEVWTWEWDIGAYCDAPFGAKISQVESRSGSNPHTQFGFQPCSTA